MHNAHQRSLMWGNRWKIVIESCPIRFDDLRGNYAWIVIVHLPRWCLICRASNYTRRAVLSTFPSFIFPSFFIRCNMRDVARKMTYNDDGKDKEKHERLEKVLGPVRWIVTRRSFGWEIFSSVTLRPVKLLWFQKKKKKKEKGKDKKKRRREKKQRRSSSKGVSKFIDSVYARTPFFSETPHTELFMLVQDKVRVHVDAVFKGIKANCKKVGKKRSKTEFGRCNDREQSAKWRARSATNFAL